MKICENATNAKILVMFEMKLHEEAVQQWDTSQKIWNKLKSQKHVIHI